MPSRQNNSMRYKANRLRSFSEGTKVLYGKKIIKWAETNDEQYIEPLAECGFYYSPSKSDASQVTCYFCKKRETIDKNMSVTNLLLSHQKANKSCHLSLIMSLELDGAVIKSDKEAFTYWSNSPKLISDPLSEESLAFRRRFFGKKFPLDLQEVFKFGSKELCESGFIYSPIFEGDDRVSCFYCNCSLERWERNDDPIFEHRANSSRYCYFLDLLDTINGHDDDQLRRGNKVSSLVPVNEISSPIHDITKLKELKVPKDSSADHIVHKGAFDEHQENSRLRRSKRLVAKKHNEDPNDDYWDKLPDDDLYNDLIGNKNYNDEFKSPTDHDNSNKQNDDPDFDESTNEESMSSKERLLEKKTLTRFDSPIKGQEVVDSANVTDILNLGSGRRGRTKKVRLKDRIQHHSKSPSDTLDHTYGESNLSDLERNIPTNNVLQESMASPPRDDRSSENIEETTFKSDAAMDQKKYIKKPKRFSIFKKNNTSSYNILDASFEEEDVSSRGDITNQRKHKLEDLRLEIIVPPTNKEKRSKVLDSVEAVNGDEKSSLKGKSNSPANVLVEKNSSPIRKKKLHTDVAEMNAHGSSNGSWNSDNISFSDAKASNSELLSRRKNNKTKVIEDSELYSDYLNDIGMFNRELSQPKRMSSQDELASINYESETHDENKNEQINMEDHGVKEVQGKNIDHEINVDNGVNNEQDKAQDSIEEDLENELLELAKPRMQDKLSSVAVERPQATELKFNPKVLRDTSQESFRYFRSPKKENDNCVTNKTAELTISKVLSEPSSPKCTVLESPQSNPGRTLVSDMIDISDKESKKIGSRSEDVKQGTSRISSNNSSMSNDDNRGNSMHLVRTNERNKLHLNERNGIITEGSGHNGRKISGNAMVENFLGDAGEIAMTSLLDRPSAKTSSSDSFCIVPDSDSIQLISNSNALKEGEARVNSASTKELLSITEKEPEPMMDQIVDENPIHSSQKESHNLYLTNHSKELDIPNHLESNYEECKRAEHTDGIDQHKTQNALEAPQMRSELKRKKTSYNATYDHVSSKNLKVTSPNLLPRKPSELSLKMSDSSTPHKNDLSVNLKKREISQSDNDHWLPLSPIKIASNLQIFKDTSNYLKTVASSRHHLHNDFDSDLTNFISAMPENEENMTIEEWIRFSASNCSKLIKEAGEDVINFYENEYLKALKILESLPTLD